MNITILTLLTSFAGLFLITAAIKDRKHLLIGTSAFLILAASGIYLSGVSYTQGYTENKYTNQTKIENLDVPQRYSEEQDKITVRIPYKTTLEKETGINNINNFLALIFLGTGLYLLIAGVVPGKYSNNKYLTGDK